MSKIYSTLSHELPLSLLYETCLNCNEGVLLYMLKTFSFDVNVPNDNGDLPLHLAARSKICMKSVALLVEKTRDINYKNNQGATPFHVLYGESDLKESLDFYTRHVLFKFLNSVMSAKGFTPLHCMCRAGKFDDFIDVLEKMQINANMQDNAVKGYPNIQDRFDEFKSVPREMKIDANMQDNAEGFTPLHYMSRARKFDEFKTVRRLRLMKRYPNKQDRFDKFKSVPREMKIDPNIQDKNGVTLLHLACEANNFLAVKFLLKLTNANPSIEDHKKQAPITLLYILQALTS